MTWAERRAADQDNRPDEGEGMEGLAVCDVCGRSDNHDHPEEFDPFFKWSDPVTNWDDGREATLPVLLPGGEFVYTVRAVDGGLISDCDGYPLVSPRAPRQILHVHTVWGDHVGAPVIELRVGDFVMLSSSDDATIQGDPDMLDAAALEIRYVPGPMPYEHDGCGS